MVQSSGIAGFGKLVKTRLQEVHQKLELGRLKYFGKLGLGSLFGYFCTPTYSLVDLLGSKYLGLIV